MLGKLIKHEFKATAKLLLPLLAAVLALMGGFQVIFLVVKLLTGRNDSHPLVAVLFALFAVLAAFALLAMLAVIVIVAVQRFYKNLLGDEGYLMFTLPATPGQQIFSKLLVSLVWSLMGIVVVILDCERARYSGKLSERNRHEHMAGRASSSAFYGVGVFQYLPAFLSLHGNRGAVAAEPVACERGGIPDPQHTFAVCDDVRYDYGGAGVSLCRYELFPRFSIFGRAIPRSVYLQHARHRRRVDDFFGCDLLPYHALAAEPAAESCITGEKIYDKADQ